MGGENAGISRDLIYGMGGETALAGLARSNCVIDV